MATDNTTVVTPIDPGDSRGAGAPGWPAIGDTKVMGGHTYRWDGQNWQRINAAG